MVICSMLVHKLGTLAQSISDFLERFSPIKAHIIHDSWSLILLILRRCILILYDIATCNFYVSDYVHTLLFKQ